MIIMDNKLMIGFQTYDKRQWGRMAKQKKNNGECQWAMAVMR